MRRGCCDLEQSHSRPSGPLTLGSRTGRSAKVGTHDVVRSSCQLLLTFQKASWRWQVSPNRLQGLARTPSFPVLGQNKQLDCELLLSIQCHVSRASSAGSGSVGALQVMFSKLSQ